METTLRLRSLRQRADNVVMALTDDFLNDYSGMQALRSQLAMLQNEVSELLGVMSSDSELEERMKLCINFSDIAIGDAFQFGGVTYTKLDEGKAKAADCTKHKIVKFSQSTICFKAGL